jgi:hypothetical protein
MIVKTTYEDCGRPASASVSQFEHNGRLVWGLSIRCDVHKHHATEIDGWGLPPVDLRKQVLLSEGTYWLRLYRDVDTVRALRTLQKALGLEIGQMARMRSNIPGAVLAGTREEVTWLLNKLRSNAINAAISAAEPDHSKSVADLSELVASDWTGKPTS